MIRQFVCSFLCSTVLTSPSFAQDDLLEKIKALEQQIQELKTLKEQQNINSRKTEQCMMAVGREKFCACIGSTLPREISFEQYVHTIISPNDVLGYSGMTQEQKSTIDVTRESRDKCIEKGFFK